MKGIKEDFISQQIRLHFPWLMPVSLLNPVHCPKTEPSNRSIGFIEANGSGHRQPHSVRMYLIYNKFYVSKSIKYSLSVHKWNNNGKTSTSADQQHYLLSPWNNSHKPTWEGYMFYFYYIWINIQAFCLNSMKENYSDSERECFINN